ncbi:TPR-like protein [Hyaloscypha variabilis F]|uniref:TPR-like protein n=1 Tax=Hyaloscypha variabilis (strain UAMH 11265 / GT02V1 / F) TaxID=1149755 RepID=A0A2J6S4X5_HYAVF|nr:TPR-like protein [Hyaloscypha variabilis F]
MNRPPTSLSAVSPGTFLFLDQNHIIGGLDDPNVARTIDTRSEVDQRTLGSREATRLRWEELKPLIQRVYIDEDKPYPYLANLLRTEHRFETTKRQFSRKIVEWGFRKNVSGSERRVILQSLPDQDIPAILYAKDPRLKPEKVRSWRKRYRDDVDDESLHCDNAQKQSFPLPMTVSANQTNVEELGGVSSPDTLQGSLPAQSPEGSVSRTEVLTEDSWLINWSTVEVPRSPNLSRLFKALKIECSNPVPALSLEPGYLPDVPTCVSETDIKDLYNDGNKLLNSECSQLYSHGKSRVSQSLPVLPTNLNSQIAHPLLKDFAEAVFFGYCSSPLNELYCFSGGLPAATPAVTLSHRTTWTALASKEADFKSKVTKLAPQFGESHPSVIAAMESLSQTYYDRRKYAEAEEWDRKLLSFYANEIGQENLKTLDALQRLVDTLVAQGKFYEARSHNRNLFSAYIKIGHLGLPRIAHTLSNDALIAEELGHTDEAESLFRQVLQLWLDYCGPRDKRTLFSMTQLGYLLVLTKGPGGDLLLRIAVQLHLEGSTATDEEACRAMTNLSAAFWAQDSHEEGCQLAKNTLERFCPVLGDEHPDVMATKVALARNMAKGGDLEGSEKLFRELVATESRISSSIELHGLSNSKCGLARVLMLRGCYDEAIKWYWEVLHTRASAFGWDYRYTLRVCYDLGECYQLCNRYDDAISLYREVVRRLWMTNRVGDACRPDIDDLERCITMFQASSLEAKALLGNAALESGMDVRLDR